MKKISLIVLLLMAALTTYAQHTLTGTVVDDKGNALLGAMVTDPKTGVSAVTGVDGTFILKSDEPIYKVRAAYVGYEKSTKTAQPGMVIKLGKMSRKSIPDGALWFVGIQALFPERNIGTVVPGLTFGWVKKYGFYLKGFLLPAGSAECESGLLDTDYWLTGKRRLSYRGATVGGIMRLGRPTFMYFGLGYSQRQVQYQGYDGSWKEEGKLKWKNNLMLDLGVQAKYRLFMFNAGLMFNMGRLYSTDFHKVHFWDRFMVNVGVNYCF